jgi:hypothetical protein
MNIIIITFFFYVYRTKQLMENSLLQSPLISAGGCETINLFTIFPPVPGQEFLAKSLLFLSFPPVLPDAMETQ